MLITFAKVMNFFYYRQIKIYERNNNNDNKKK